MGDLLLFDILRPESSHLLSRTRAEASAASENFKQKAIRLVENGQTLVANKMGCPRNGWLLEVIAGIMERGEETCISEPYAQGVGSGNGKTYVHSLNNQECAGESDGLFSIPEPHRHRKLLSMREDPRYCRQSEVLDQTVYVHKLSRILEFQSAKVGTIGAEVIFK